MRRLHAVAAALAVLVTTAGACRQEPDGPPPAPATLGASPFPEGATAGGLAATYARLTREEADGEQCFRILRLSVDGTAAVGNGCSNDGVEALVADEESWVASDQAGDYAHRDGRVWVRIVEWDALAEEFVLAEAELVSCGTELRLTEEPQPFLVVHPYRLVTGTPPPGSPRCEPSA